MRLVSLSNCKPGMILARPAYEEGGKLLVAGEMALTQRYIDRLKEYGVSVLYIRDKVTNDIEVVDVIPLEIRLQAVSEIKTVFSEIQSGKTRISDLIKENHFKNVIQSILFEIKSSKRAIDLLTHIHVNDHYIFSHSLNVMIYTTTLAIAQGLNNDKVHELALGCLLHDIGKLFVPEEVLNKPGELNAEEFEQMKKHTEHGYNLLRREPDISLLVAHCAYQHHEKWDGTGYPRGLKGEEIHLYARLITVGDVFDALTSRRIYRKALLPHEAMEIILAGSNLHFQQEVVELFREKIAIYPVGMTVKLNTGETGVVVDCNSHSLDRPVVRVFLDPAGVELEHFNEIDLSKHLSVMIVECNAII